VNAEESDSRVKVLLDGAIAGYASKRGKIDASESAITVALLWNVDIKNRSIMIAILGSRNGNLEMPNGSPILGSVSQWRIYALIFRGRCRMALSATSPTAFQSADAQFGRLIPRIFTRFNGYNASLDFSVAGERQDPVKPAIFRNSTVILLLRYKMAFSTIRAAGKLRGLYRSTLVYVRVREFFPSAAIRNGLKTSCRV